MMNIMPIEIRSMNANHKEKATSTHEHNFSLQQQQQSQVKNEMISSGIEQAYANYKTESLHENALQWQVRKVKDRKLNEKRSFKESKKNSKSSEKLSKEEKDSYNEMTPLPPSFRPGPYDVICGRGKDVLQNPGNRRYRQLINASLRSYVATSTKLEKTLLVTSIIRMVEEFSTTGSGFIKKSNGTWYKVSESYAREKCGQSIRDALHTEYRSSSRAKAGRRKLSSSSKHSTSGRTAKSQSQTDDEQLDGPFGSTNEDSSFDGFENDEDDFTSRINSVTDPGVEQKKMNHPSKIQQMYQDSIPLNSIYCQWGEGNESHHLRDAPFNWLPEIGQSLERILGFCPTSRSMSTSTMVSMVTENLVPSSNSIGVKNFLPNDIEDPDGLDLMVQSMVWDD